MKRCKYCHMNMDYVYPTQNGLCSSRPVGSSQICGFHEVEDFNPVMETLKNLTDEDLSAFADLIKRVDQKIQKEEKGMSEEFVTKEDLQLMAEDVIEGINQRFEGHILSSQNGFNILNQKIKDLSDWALDVKQAQDDDLEKLQRFVFALVKTVEPGNSMKSYKDFEKGMKEVDLSIARERENISTYSYAVAVVYGNPEGEIWVAVNEEAGPQQGKLVQATLLQTIIAASDELAAIKIVEDHLLREHGENLHIISRVATRIENV